MPKGQPAASSVLISPRRRFAPVDLPELWRYRELVYFLTMRTILARYKQTALGLGWAILQPLTMMVVFTLFFGSFAKQFGVPGPVFFYAGLVPWTLFASGVSQASNSLVGNANLISKVYFPRLSAPLAAVLAPVVDFAAAFVILIGLMLAYGLTPDPWAIVAIPGLVALAVITSLGVGLWLSTLSVKYRDVQYVVPFLVQIGLFASGVVFSPANLSEPWRTLLGLNPIAGVIAGFRAVLLNSGPPVGSLFYLSIPAALLLLVSGALYFRQMERTFADLI
jgi:lipopolysaccharide transport system permease protein